MINPNDMNQLLNTNNNQNLNSNIDLNKNQNVMPNQQFNGITFVLTVSQQSEIVNIIHTRYTEMRAAYQATFDKIKTIQAARNCKNDFNPIQEQVISQNTTEEETQTPNIHDPVIQSIATPIIGTLMSATIGSPNFLAIKAVNKNDSDIENDILKAYMAVVRETGSDIINSEILEQIVYEGTCPVVIVNDSKFNTIHNKLYTWIIPLNDPEEQKIFQTTGIIIQEKIASQNGINFYTMNLSKQESPDTIWTTFQDQDDLEIRAIDLLEAFLTNEQGLYHIDLSRRQVKNIEIYTTQEYIEGLPTPKILDIQKAMIMPSMSLLNNPEDHNWIYTQNVRIYQIYDNPNYINKDKLKNNNNSNSGTIIEDNNESLYNNYSGENISKIQFNEPVVKIRTAYFDYLKFKDGMELRNFIVETVDDKIMIQCSPCFDYTIKSGKKISTNPFMWFVYNKDPNAVMGKSPLFDVLDLSKAINIITNHILDSLSRRNNEKIYVDCVEVKTKKGGNGITILVDPQEMKNLGVTNVNNLVGNLNQSYDDINAIAAVSEQLKTKANSVSQATHAFMAQKRYDSTATEVSQMAATANEVMKIIIIRFCNQIRNMHQRILDRLINDGHIIESLPSYDKSGTDITFDFSLLRGKKFYVETLATNPNLSKGFQIQMLESLLTMAIQSQNPEVLSRINISEITKSILDMSEITNKNIVREDQEAQQELLEISQKDQIFEMYQAGLLIPNQEKIQEQQEQQQQSQGQTQQ